LLPEAVGDEVARESATIRQAVGTLSFSDASVIVVLSPHAKSTGVYRSIEGSLDDFSVRGVDLEWPTDRSAVNALAELWGEPVLKDPVDHGVLVALKLLAAADKPVIAAGIRETESSGPQLNGHPDEPGGAPGASGATGATGATRARDAGGMGAGEQRPPRDEEQLIGTQAASGAIAEGISFGRALLRFAQEMSVAFVASAHTSSALLPRAPLTERAEAKPVEAAVMDALGSDASRIETSLMDLWVQGGSCSVGSVAAYGEVFGGRGSEILAYGYPFGVGYVVARVV
jgi:hypothetical protein